MRSSTSTAANWKASPNSAPAGSAAPPNVDGALGEALGQVYVQQYFAGDSKAKTLQMVHDIEVAMYHDIGTLDWMSDATKAKAREKLHAVAEKIGYPDHWRDYAILTVWSSDAFGNAAPRHRL